MTEVINVKELQTPPWEPKVQHRFIVKVKNFSSWSIFRIERPKANWDFGSVSYIWQPIEMELYDPICPSTSQLVYELIETHNNQLGDITLKLLGPVGDVVENWTLQNCSILRIDFGELDWSIESERRPKQKPKKGFTTIKLLIQYTAELEF